MEMDLTLGRSPGTSRVWTTETTPVQIPVRLDFDAHAAGFSRALSHLDNAATKELDRVDFDPRLRELVGSGPRRSTAAPTASTCTPRTPARSARPSSGSTRCRPGAETPFFTERERAALALTEAVTLLARDHVPQEVFDATAEHFDADELAALVSLVVTINAWNAVGVSTRTWTPGSYER